ncbi:lipocalin family protein [Maribacter thermophilus]|uniref:lipocalin family protein n=1 Tax=Maribacter thermophilus TaxID=1197874 RepID=UPI000ADB203E|nr:lipocalin family protein [Maribacter thermophilus]
MKKNLLLILILSFFSCNSSDENSDSQMVNENSELLIGKWAYVSVKRNGSIIDFVHSGEGCSDFKPDYIEFTENGRYIQFAFLNCQEEFSTNLLYKLVDNAIIVSYESTNEEAFTSEIIEISSSTLILRTISNDIVLEEGFSKIE